MSAIKRMEESKTHCYADETKSINNILTKSDKVLSKGLAFPIWILYNLNC